MLRLRFALAVRVVVRAKAAARSSTILLGVLLASGLFTPAHAQVSDVTPPQLQALAFTPSAVDVSASSRSVIVDMDVTDNLSGVASVLATFVSPNGTIAEQSAVNVGGITYRSSITIPRYAANGTWLLNVTLVDAVGNRAVVTSTVLQARGLPFGLAVTSTPVDNAAPVPVSMSFSPSAVDVSSQSQLVTVQIHVNDDLSGIFFDPTFVAAFSFILQSPSGQQIRLSNPDFTITGTPQASLWQATFEVPRYADAATWRVVLLRVVDAAGNLRNMTLNDLTNAGVTTPLVVMSTVSDRTPPSLAGFSFSPAVINTALGPQTVHVKLDLVDDLAGVSFLPRTFFNRLFFTSPSGQSVAAFRTDFSQTVGSPLNGRWEANLVFPQFSEAGTWNATFLRLEDATYNLRFLNQSGIAGLGFPTSLVAIRPSLTVDGSLGPGGGVVQDQTFGARAAVIAPSNVLPGNTNVAIDVLTSPLALPTPTGFETTGSLYVNIQLTPNPSPLPAPGLTVVLPLPSPQPPGLLLTLYKIDPATGTLVPSKDAGGVPISGIVGTNGLSATFSGVVSFSTVVGLLPDRQTIAIKVKGGDGAPINLRSNGVTPVAVLSSADFDAADVDVSSVTFAGAPAQRSSLEDVDGDGLLDQVFQFATPELKLPSGDSQATLDGRTFAGLRVRGTSAVKVRP